MSDSTPVARFQRKIHHEKHAITVTMEECDHPACRQATAVDRKLNKP